MRHVKSFGKSKISNCKKGILLVTAATSGGWDCVEVLLPKLNISEMFEIFQ